MTREFTVGDMSCSHCLQAITKEVSTVAGVNDVRVYLGSKRVSVEANAQVATETMINAINEAGYGDITVLR